MGKTFERVALTGVLLGGAFLITKTFDLLPECVAKGELSACLPKGHAEPAQPVYGDIEVESEDLVGSASYITYGEVSIKIGGDESKLDYDDPSVLDFAGDIDATMYWNHDGDSSMELLYNPCVKKTDDYTVGTAEVQPSLDNVGTEATVGASAPAERPNGSFEYKVDIDETTGAINSVNINAGILDTCFMRIAPTLENDRTFYYNPDNQRPVGAREDATFRYDMQTMITKYALSQACPEAVIELPAVKDDLARVALGDLSAQYPDKAQLFSEAYNAGKFNVFLEAPEVRREAYLEVFEDFRDEVKNRERTLPDKDGNTAKMKKPKMGDFEVTQCSEIVSDFAIQKIED